MTDCPNTPLNHTPAKVYAHSMAAIDWLEANPEKQLTGMFAATADRRYVRHRDPDAACFCVLGRIAKDVGLHNICHITSYMRIIGVEDDDVADMNDAGEPLSKIRDHITRQYERTSLDD